jgi:hypothetical protein
LTEDGSAKTSMMYSGGRRWSIAFMFSSIWIVVLVRMDEELEFGGVSAYAISLMSDSTYGPTAEISVLSHSHRFQRLSPRQGPSFLGEPCCSAHAKR